MNTENSKANESKKCIYQFTDKLNLKDPNNKNIVLVNLSIYYTWRNIKSAYNKNKCKVSDPTWNDEFDLLNGSHTVSDIQDYFQYVIEKHETIANISPVQIYPNKVKNRIFFKIKTSYKLELLSPETMKLLGSAKKKKKKKMLIKIKTEKMFQNQNLLKSFQYTAIQSITVTRNYLKYYLLLYLINNLVS